MLLTMNCFMALLFRWNKAEYIRSEYKIQIMRMSCVNEFNFRYTWAGDVAHFINSSFADFTETTLHTGKV